MICRGRFVPFFEKIQAMEKKKSGTPSKASIRIRKTLDQKSQKLYYETLLLLPAL